LINNFSEFLPSELIQQANKFIMARRNNRSRRGGSKNAISNVRIVDKDDGTDDIQCQRFLQAYKVSEGQIRVVCGYRGELSQSTTSGGGVVATGELAGTDDFTSFTAQYKEFRVRAIRFDIYDLATSTASAINFWSTFHQIGGAVAVGFDDVVDRPDSRAISPGTGMTSLAWVAHSIPEMAFQDTANYNGLGGLSYYIGGGPTATNKFSIVAKFIVDFRGRR
jgi:hypothetical protein